MPSTYTTNIGIEKIATGEQSGTWGTTTNTNFDLIDTAVNGIVSVPLASAGTSGSPNDLPITDGTASNGRNKFIEFVDGGDLGATAYVQLTPNDAEKIVHIRNSLSGSRSIIVFQGTYNASNDFEIPNGADVTLKFNGGGTGATVTDVNVDLTVTGATIATADINGGTIDGTVIGGSSAAAGTFTTFTSTGIDDNATSTKLTVADSAITTGSIDQLIIAHSTDGGGIRIDSTNSTNTGSLRFGDDLDNYIGALEYNHTSNAMSMYVNNATRMTVDSSGNVGIGTASPARTLDVSSGAAGVAITTKGSGTGSYITFQDGTTTNDAKVRVGAVGDNLTLFGGGSERMRIDASGNVGIGTTSPNAYANYTTLTLNGATSSALDFEGGGTLMAEVLATANDLILQTTNSDGQLIFRSAAGSEAVRIDSSGNLGLNTTAPSSYGGGFVVDDLGINIVTASSGSPGTNKLSWWSDSNGISQNAYISVVNDGATTNTGEMVFYTKNASATLAERMRIDASGNVGIGTTSPTNSLHVAGSGTAALIEGTGGAGFVGIRDSDDGTIGYIGVDGGKLLFQTSGSSYSTKLAIDTTGNVGIGTTSPQYELSFGTGYFGLNYSTGKLALYQANSTSHSTAVESIGSVEISSSITGSGAGAIKFNTLASERMRIDSSGNLLVGTSSLGGNSGRFQAVRSNSGAIGYFEVNNGSGVQNAVDITNAANAAFSPLRFWVNGYGTGSLVGSISCTTSATAYNTSSDQRLKDNIVDAPAGNINDIRVRSFDWKADGTHQPYGMIAQELVEVAPEAVTQGETEEDMWGVDYSKLVPMMIKEIQDLKAEVAALKGA